MSPIPNFDLAHFVNNLPPELLQKIKEKGGTLQALPNETIEIAFAGSIRNLKLHLPSWEDHFCYYELKAHDLRNLEIVFERDVSVRIEATKIDMATIVGSTGAKDLTLDTEATILVKIKGTFADLNLKTGSKHDYFEGGKRGHVLTIDSHPRRNAVR